MLTNEILMSNLKFVDQYYNRTTWYRIILCCLQWNTIFI